MLRPDCAEIYSDGVPDKNELSSNCIKFYQNSKPQSRSEANYTELNTTFLKIVIKHIIQNFKNFRSVEILSI